MHPLLIISSGDDNHQGFGSISYLESMCWCVQHSEDFPWQNKGIWGQRSRWTLSWTRSAREHFPSQIFSGAFIAKVIFNEQPGYFVLKSALPKMCSKPSNKRIMICSLKMDPVLELAPVEAMTSSLMIWQWRSTPSCSFRGRAVNLRRATDHWPSERTLSSLRGTLLSSQFITRSKTCVTYPGSVWSVLF